MESLNHPQDPRNTQRFHYNQQTNNQEPSQAASQPARPVRPAQHPSQASPQMPAPIQASEPRHYIPGQYQQKRVVRDPGAAYDYSGQQPPAKNYGRQSQPYQADVFDHQPQGYNSVDDYPLSTYPIDEDPAYNPARTRKLRAIRPGETPRTYYSNTEDEQRDTRMPANHHTQSLPATRPAQPLTGYTSRASGSYYRPDEHTSTYHADTLDTFSTQKQDEVDFYDEDTEFESEEGLQYGNWEDGTEDYIEDQPSAPANYIPTGSIPHHQGTQASRSNRPGTPSQPGRAREAGIPVPPYMQQNRLEERRSRSMSKASDLLTQVPQLTQKLGMPLPAPSHQTQETLKRRNTQPLQPHIVEQIELERTHKTGPSTSGPAQPANRLPQSAPLAPQKSSPMSGPINTSQLISSPTRTTTIGPGSCTRCRGTGFLRANVPYGHPQFGKALPCECKEQERKEKRRQQLRELSNLDAFRDKSFENFRTNIIGVQEAYQASIAFANNPDGWLVLVGPNGCGKTHLAAAVANQLLDRGSVVLFEAVPDLLDHLRGAFAPNASEMYDQLFAKMREAEILVLDDLGTQQSSPWATEKLFQLLNYRYNMFLPTVITANQRGMQNVDERIRSRISDVGLSTYVNIDRAQDFRPRNVRK